MIDGSQVGSPQEVIFGFDIGSHGNEGNDDAAVEILREKRFLVLS